MIIIDKIKDIVWGVGIDEWFFICVFWDCDL